MWKAVFIMVCLGLGNFAFGQDEIPSPSIPMPSPPTSYPTPVPAPAYNVGPYPPTYPIPSNAPILLHISIIKISLTKLRAQRVDFDEFLAGETAAAEEGNKKTNREDDDLFGKPSPAMQGTLVLPREDQFFVKLRKLLKSDAAKIVAQPKMTTYNGRPTSFHSGGEFPVPVMNPQGMMTMEWKKYGKEIACASCASDRETIHLDIRATFSKVDPKLSLATKEYSIPGLQTSTLDTACKIKVGQIAVFSGGRQSGSFDDSAEPAVVENASQTDAKAPATPIAAEEFALLMLIKPEIADSRNTQPEMEMPLR